MYIQDILDKKNLKPRALPFSLSEHQSPSIHLPSLSNYTQLSSVAQNQQAPNLFGTAFDGLKSLFGAGGSNAKSAGMVGILKDLINIKYKQLPFHEFFGVPGTYLAAAFIDLRDIHDVESLKAIIDNRLSDGTDSINSFINQFDTAFSKHSVDEQKLIFAELLHHVTKDIYQEKDHAISLLTKLVQMFYDKMFSNKSLLDNYDALAKIIRSYKILNIKDSRKQLEYILWFATEKLGLTDKEKVLLHNVSELMAKPNHSVNYIYQDFMTDILGVLKIYVDKFELKREFDSNGTAIYTFNAVSCDLNDIYKKLKELVPDGSFNNIEVRIYCEKSLIVHKNKINLPSLNLVIIAPQILAVDDQINISTKGAKVSTDKVPEKDKRGGDGSKPSENGGRGAHGENGVYGNPGGHIYLLCNEIVALKGGQLQLDLHAEGSNGGDGQNGGDGGNAANGDKGIDADISIDKKILSSPHILLKYCYGIPGQPGGKGGNGGNGGAPGKGGYYGLIEVFSTDKGMIHEFKEKVQAGYGKPGTPGAGGDGGINGKPGRDQFLYSVKHVAPKQEQRSQHMQYATPGEKMVSHKGCIEHFTLPRDDHEPGKIYELVGLAAPGISPFHAIINDPDLEIRHEEGSSYFSADERAENGRNGSPAEANTPANRRLEINITACIEEYIKTLSKSCDCNFDAIADLMHKLSAKYQEQSLTLDTAYLVNMREVVERRQILFQHNVYTMCEFLHHPSDAERINMTAFIIDRQQRLGLDFQSQKEDGIPARNEITRIHAGKKQYLLNALQLSNQIKDYESYLENCNDPYNTVLLDSLFAELQAKNQMFKTFEPNIFVTISEGSPVLTSLLEAIRRFNVEPGSDDLRSVLELTIKCLSSEAFMDAYKNMNVSMADITKHLKAVRHNCTLAKDNLKLNNVVSGGVYLAIDLQISIEVKQLLKDLDLRLGDGMESDVASLGDLRVRRDEIITHRLTTAVNNLLLMKYAVFFQGNLNGLQQLADIYIDQQRASVVGDECVLSEKIQDFETQVLMYILNNTTLNPKYHISDWQEISAKLIAALHLKYDANIVYALLVNLFPDQDFGSNSARFIQMFAKWLKPSNVFYYSELLHVCFFTSQNSVKQYAQLRLTEIITTSSQPLDDESLASLVFVLRDLSDEIAAGRIEMPSDRERLHKLHLGLSLLIPSHPQLAMIKQGAEGVDISLQDLIAKIKNKFGNKFNPALITYLLKKYSNGATYASQLVDACGTEDEFKQSLAVKIVNCMLDDFEQDCRDNKTLFYGNNLELCMSLAKKTAETMLDELLEDNADAISAYEQALQKYCKFYAASKVGMPVERFNVILKMMFNSGDYQQALALIVATDPDCWYDEIIKLNLKSLLQVKLQPEKLILRSLFEDIDQAQAPYIKILLNKLVATYNNDPSEVSKAETPQDITIDAIQEILAGLNALPYSSDLVLFLADAKLSGWPKIFHMHFIESFSTKLFKDNINDALSMRSTLEGIYNRQSSKSVSELLDLVLTLSGHGRHATAAEMLTIMQEIYCENLEVNDLRQILKDNPNKKLMPCVDAFLDKKRNESHELSFDEVVEYLRKQDTKLDLSSAIQHTDLIIKKTAEIKHNLESNSSDAKHQWYQASKIKQLNDIRKGANPNKANDLQEFLNNNFAAIIADICIAFWLAMDKNLRVTQIFTLVLLATAKDRGLLTQVKTGEGKTNIVAAFAIYKASLGFKVDITTSEITLAREGMEKTKVYYELCQVGVDLVDLSSKSINHYECFKSDVVYGTTGNFQSCYLSSITGQKDCESYKGRYANTPKCMIVDEADNALLDRACHMLYKPLTADDLYPLENLDINLWAAIISMSSTTKEDIEREIKIIASTMNRLIDDGSISIPAHQIDFCKEQMLSWTQTAYDMKVSKQINTDFRLDITQPEGYKETGKDRKLKIIDIDTGSIEEKMRLSNGASQNLDFRYRSRYQPRSPTCDFISNYEFYRGYGAQLFGLSGTLGTTETRKVYDRHFGLDTIDIPPHMTKRFVTNPAKYALDKQQWFRLIGKEIGEKADKHPILIVFELLEDIEAFTAFIKIKYPEPKFTYFKHYEKQDNIEAALKTHDGAKKKFLIIASNKGGRGTDIIPHDESKNGLYVIATYMPESSRVFEQMMGRAGRCGQIGGGCIIARVYQQLIARCVNQPNEYIDMLMRQTQNTYESERIQRSDQRIAAKALEERLAGSYRELCAKVLAMEQDDETSYAVELKSIIEQEVRTLRAENRSVHYTLPSKTYEYLKFDYTEYCKVLRRSMLGVLRKKWAMWFTLNNHKMIVADTEAKRKDIEAKFRTDFIDRYEAIFRSKSFGDVFLQSGSDYNLAADGLHSSLAEIPYAPNPVVPSKDTEADAEAQLYAAIRAKVYQRYMANVELYTNYLERAIQLQEISGTAAFQLIYHYWKNPSYFKGENLRKYTVQKFKSAHHSINMLRAQLQQNMSVAHFLKESADVSFDISKHEDFYKRGNEERAHICDLHLRIINSYIGEKLKIDAIQGAIAEVAGMEHEAVKEDNCSAIYKKLIDSNLVYVDRIRKQWLKMDRRLATEILQQRLRNVGNIIPLSELMPLIFSGNRNLNMAQLQSRCISQDGLWNLLASKNAIFDTQEVYLIGSESILLHEKLAGVKEKLISLFITHGLKYQDTGLIYCPAGHSFGGAMNSEENKDLLTALQSLGMPKKTRVGKFNLPILKNHEVFENFKGLKIYNSEGELLALPDVIYQMAEESEKTLHSHACEEFLPYRPSKQQADTVLYNLHSAGILKSGGLADKSKRDRNVLTAHLNDLLLRSDSGFHLDQSMVDAIAGRFDKMRHSLYDMDGEITTHLVRFKDIFPRREEPYELRHYFAGLKLDYFLVINVQKKAKRDVTGAFVVAVIGIAQIVVGAMLVTMSGGTLALIGQYLIKEGVGDLMYAAMALQRGSFSWEDWATHKAISLAISITCFALDYYAQVLEGGADASLARDAADQTYTMSEIFMQAAKDVLLGVVENLITDAAIDSALRILSDKLVALILNSIIPKVEEQVKENLDEFFQKSPKAADYHDAVNKMKDKVRSKLEANGREAAKIEQTRTRVKQLLDSVTRKFEDIRRLRSAPGYVAVAAECGRAIMIANAIYEELKPILQINDMSVDIRKAVDKIAKDILSTYGEVPQDSESISLITSDVKANDADEIMSDVRMSLKMIVDAELSQRLNEPIRGALQFLGEKLQTFVLENAYEQDDQKGIEQIRKNAKQKTKPQDIEDKYLESDSALEASPSENEQRQRKEKKAEDLTQKKARIKNALKKDPDLELLQDHEDTVYARGPRVDDLRDGNAEDQKTPEFESVAQMKEHADREFAKRHPPLLGGNQGQATISSLTKNEYESMVLLSQRSQSFIRIHAVDSLDEFTAAFSVSREVKLDDKSKEDMAAEAKRRKNAARNMKRRNQKVPDGYRDVDSKEVTTESSLLLFSTSPVNPSKGSDPCRVLETFGEHEFQLGGYSRGDKVERGDKLKIAGEIGLNLFACRHRGELADLSYGLQAGRLAAELKVTGVSDAQAANIQKVQAKLSLEAQIVAAKGKLVTPVACFNDYLFCTRATFSGKAGLGAAAKLNAAASGATDGSYFKYKGSAGGGTGVYGKLGVTVEVFFPRNNPDMLRAIKASPDFTPVPRPKY